MRRTISQTLHNLKISTSLLSFIITILVVSKETEERFALQNLERQTIHSYCKSFKSCHNCKKAAFQCEWCHDAGCTNHPRVHCPKKQFLDNIWKKDTLERYCTEIVTKSPIFVPANVRRFLRLDMKVDDMTLYERNVVCEIQIEERIIQVSGSFDKDTVYCDTTVLKITRNVAIGYLKLLWGGVEPQSNTILLIVYNCHSLAQNCKECQVLNREFQCGWCQDTVSCTLIEECPRQYGLWIDRNFTCGREKNVIAQYDKNLRGLWD